MAHIFTTVTEPRSAPVWATNAVAERIDERAEEEFRTCAPAFVEWIRGSDIDVCDLAPLLAAAARVYSEDGRKDVDDCVQDYLLAYKQFRSATADDRDEILLDVLEGAAEER